MLVKWMEHWLMNNYTGQRLLNLPLILHMEKVRKCNNTCYGDWACSVQYCPPPSPQHGPV